MSRAKRNAATAAASSAKSENEAASKTKGEATASSSQRSPSVAKPATSIVVNEEHLAFEFGLAMQLPVKVHLENPLLGSGCYIGSSSSPLIWNLTTGKTNPPAGTTPITGTSGHLEYIEENKIAEFQNAKLVDNGWSAPGASGCGGWPAEYVLDPIIESSVGVPSAAGKNVANLDKTRISLALAEAVNKH